MTTMKIGLDAKRIVRNGTGLGSYGRTLVNDLSQAAGGELSLHLYAPDQGRDDLRNQIVMRPNVTFHFKTDNGQQTTDNRPLGQGTQERQQTTVQKGTWAQGLKYGLWRTYGIVSDLKRDGIQLFHGLSGELPVGLRKAGIKSVVTIHDLIFLRHPEYYHWLDTKIYAWKFRQTIREADRIIAISERTKQDIMELGGVKEDKITVVYQSFSPRFGPLPASPDEGRRKGSWLPPYRRDERGAYPYLLSVGTIEERKNILLAVKALCHLPETLSLVIVGRRTKYADKVRQWADQHGLSHRVVMRHDVTDDELPSLYAGAEAFVYPSRYEGFGIPIIEAIAMGLPVVAATGSCLEEAGGPHSLYVNPDDAEGMAVAIRQLLHGAEGREERIIRSREYIRRFEGSDVAAQVMEIYRSVGVAGVKECRSCRSVGV